MEYNFTQYINDAIKNTAALFNNDTITTAKDMIPAMNPERTKDITKILDLSQKWMCISQRALFWMPEK